MTRQRQARYLFGFFINNSNRHAKKKISWHHWQLPWEMREKMSQISGKMTIFQSAKPKFADNDPDFDKALTGFAKKLSKQEKTLLGGGA